MARSNGFEGGSDETNVTIGNSGGASGDALDDVGRGTGATVVYDNAFAANGTYSVRTATGGTLAVAYVSYALANVTGDFSRSSFRLTSLPSAAAQPVLRYMSGANQAFRVNVKSAGTIEVRDAANNVAGTTTAAITAGQFWRMELRPVLSTTVGAVELRYWANPNSTGSPTETLNLTGLALTASANEVRFGVGAGLANAVAAWIDDIAVEGATWHGPAVRSITLSGIAVAAALGDAVVAQSLAVAPDGIGVPGTIGTPAVAQPLTVTPSGIAAAASLGSPTIAQALTVLPSGLAVPIALGDLAAALDLSVTPDGVAVPVVTGDPSAPAGAFPAGIAVPVQLGDISVSQPIGTTIPRPFTGAVSRPSAGVIARPDSGVTERP